ASQGVLSPAACMNWRIPQASAPSAITLAAQITTSQVSRCHSGLTGGAPVSGTRLAGCAVSGPRGRSVVAIVGTHLAAEHVVAPGRVHENQRNDQQRAYQREPLAFRRRGSLPDAHVRRDDVGPEADAQATVTKENQRQGEQERCVVSVTGN